MMLKNHVRFIWFYEIHVLSKPIYHLQPANYFSENDSFFQSPLTTYNLRCFFHNLHFFWRCTWFYENIKVPYRNSLQYAEARTSRSLLRVRKRKETIFTKHPLWGGGRRRRRRQNLPKTSSPRSHRTQGWNIPFGHPPHFDYNRHNDCWQWSSCCKNGKRVS